MSDSEHSSSDSSSERSEAMSASDGEGSSSCFLFKSNFAPYQGEPLAGDGEMADNDGEEEEEGDEDGLLPSVLAQRFEGRVAVNEWCTCGNCSVEHLVGAREFRCCLEVNQARGKFTFVGLDAQCILNHPDFSALTNRTVLDLVGPLLTDKDGRHYRRRNNAENKFFRAVSYRWLARWLFGPLGWEKTRPLPSCVYHKLRTQFHTHETTGYVPGQERANENA